MLFGIIRLDSARRSVSKDVYVEPPPLKRCHRASLYWVEAVRFTLQVEASDKTS